VNDEKILFKGLELGLAIIGLSVVYRAVYREMVGE